MTQIDPEVQLLWRALKTKGIAAQIDEQGEANSDLIIPEAKINIKIESEKTAEASEILEEIQSEYSSFKKGYFRLKIPGFMIRDNLNELCELIAELVEQSRQKELSEDEDSEDDFPDEDW